MTTKRSPGRPYIHEITPTQQRTLEAIQAFIRRTKLSPTMAELAIELDVTPASAHEQIIQLVRKGYLSQSPRKARSIIILQAPTEPVADLVEIPILGSVAAGCPILAEENVTGHVTIDGTLAARGKCFALTVRGDSMIRAKINNGDLVIVRHQAMAENGDIVVAMLNGEVTVKRLSISEEVIRLMPENTKYRPIPVDPDADFRIVGKVIGTRRKQAV